MWTEVSSSDVSFYPLISDHKYWMKIEQVTFLLYMTFTFVCVGIILLYSFEKTP